MSWKMKKSRLIILLILFLLALYTFYETQLVHHHRLWGQFGRPLSSKDLLRGENLRWNNPDACLQTSSSKSIVIVVHSARGHFKHRSLIRSTWGSVRQIQNWTLLAVMFVIGRGRSDVFDRAPYFIRDNARSPKVRREEEARISRKLEIERGIHNDLIMGDFIDDYRNMPIKATTAFKWIVDHCSHAKLVMKMDDDVIVNIFQLVRYLNQNLPTDYLLKGGSAPLLFHCHIRDKDMAERNPLRFWYISEEEYPKLNLPPTCLGMAHVTTVRTIQVLRETMREFDYVPFIDDLFYLGIVVERYNENAMKREGNMSRGNETSNLIKQVDMGRHAYFWTRNVRNYEMVLHKWYSENGVLIDRKHGVEVRDSDVNMRSVLFFLIHSRGRKYAQDWIGTWTRIKLNEQMRRRGKEDEFEINSRHNNSSEMRDL